MQKLNLSAIKKNTPRPLIPKLNFNFSTAVKAQQARKIDPIIEEIKRKDAEYWQIQCKQAREEQRQTMIEVFEIKEKLSDYKKKSETLQQELASDVLLYKDDMLSYKSKYEITLCQLEATKKLLETAIREKKSLEFKNELLQETYMQPCDGEYEARLRVNDLLSDISELEEEREALYQDNLAEKLCRQLEAAKRKNQDTIKLYLDDDEEESKKEESEEEITYESIANPLEPLWADEFESYWLWKPEENN